MVIHSTLVSAPRNVFRAAVLVVACSFAAPVSAQQNDTMTPIATPNQPHAIGIGTAPLPDAQAQESWHSQYGSTFARNVTVATITPFLPDPAKASGAAVVVAPGGGFRTLSMENEGWNVARALADRGVAAFVLKYRLNQTPADMAGFERSMKEMFSSAARPRPATPPDPQQMMAGLAPQLEDARAAFALIRRRAAEWKIDPNRIGMVGFSAGAMLTLATELAGQDAKPAFIGIIYGPLAPVTVPADAPPLFVALAADDPLFANGGFGLIDSWRAAKKPAEFHLYEQGGHGFGMYPKETTSTGWFNAFVSWLTMHGMVKPTLYAQSHSPAPDTSGTKRPWTNVVGAEWPRVDAQCRAHFRVDAPKAQSVTVSLGPTALTKGEDGVWTGITPPQNPGFHIYRLTIDGVEVNDTSSESFWDAGGIYSGIDIIEDGLDHYDVKNVPHGEVRSVWYFAKSTGEQRHAYVYTPPGYDAKRKQRYPVLYLLHGMNQDRRVWSQQGRANFILDNLIAAGKAKPMILVMEDGGIIRAGLGPRGGAGARQGGPGAGGGRGAGPQSGGGPNFWDAFCKILVADVIPMVDSQFRTLPDAGHRAIAGLSLGGAQTYQITQANLDTFAYIGVFSAAPFGFSGVETAYGGLLAKPAEFAKKVKVFYVSLGSKERPNAGRSMHEALEKAGVAHVYFEAPGTAHEFETWRKSLHGFAPLLFQK